MYVLVKYFVYFIWIASQFSAFFVVLNMFVLIGDWISTYVNRTVATVLIETLSLVLLVNTVVYCNSLRISLTFSYSEWNCDAYGSLLSHELHYKHYSLALLKNVTCTYVQCSCYPKPTGTTDRTVSMFMSPSSTKDTISLTWNVSSPAFVTGYFISFKRTDVSSDLTPQWVFIEGATTSHTLSNLLGGTNYDITLRLVDNFGVSNEEPTNASTSEGSKCMV